MWLWIVVGGLAYAALMVVLFGLLRAAGEADRRERALFRAWVHARKRGARAPEGGRSAA
jgi:hypothetical protein